MSASWLALPLSASWTGDQRLAVQHFARKIAHQDGPDRIDHNPGSGNPAVVAACSVLMDLASQGWQLQVDRDDTILLCPPHAGLDACAEKQRVRQQELLKRTEQLSTPSVRRFIERMERPREHDGAFVSIFSLMRDGAELAKSLETHDDLSLSVHPYVQVIQSDTARCDYTGLRLIDVWRYFRHTWANQYTSTPGRTMQLLVRDRAAPFHPVIGIAALGSSIVQIRERDDWIGWQPSTLLDVLDESPSLSWARWLAKRLDGGFAEIYVQDLIEDGIYWPALWDSPTADGIEKLRREAEIRRKYHRRFGRRSDFTAPMDQGDEKEWTSRAETDLFRSKRCLALADLLSARLALLPHILPKPSTPGLRRALEDPRARRAIAQMIRRAKGEAVGTEIADLTVCGAIPPYNQLIGGKLVSMLAISPTVVRAYHDKYGSYASQIASSIAGRPIRRRSNLAFVGTTSLYGSSSSQYNRLELPTNVLGSREPLKFVRIGGSRSFGSSHLSKASVDALTIVSEQSRTGARVRSIFGEGVNPKLRKLRDGLDILGWPSDELLQHRRSRIVYGVRLVDNLLDYLLGFDEQPHYSFRKNVAEDVDRISNWWRERWLRMRVRPDILDGVREHRLERPVLHGARVVLPELPARD